MNGGYLVRGFDVLDELKIAYPEGSVSMNGHMLPTVRPV